MPFIPHTPDDERLMLEVIGVSSIENLFDEIPPELGAGELTDTPSGISEMAMMRLMEKRARQDEVPLCFIGAGAYEHHIPAAVWDLASRGEFMTAYTPFQAEASQGALQLVYEYQTMMSRLMALPVANASVYDGASALAEAILMALRANKKNPSRRVLIAGDTHPGYVKVCETILGMQGIELELLSFDEESGELRPATLAQQEDYSALVIAYPSFFGVLNDVDALTNQAQSQGALVIGVVNPIAMALLPPPGAWGERGADIAVGEGQPLGIPLASGGPYLGFICCRQDMVRQMPGRIVGRTVDQDGRQGFTLTLQAREQHIRRAKATSNICTNQGLQVTAATIYLSLLGDRGLRSVAARCYEGLHHLLQAVTQVEGVRPRFTGGVFHEAVLSLPVPADQLVAAMAQQGLLAGYALGQDWQGLSHALLVNVTETKTAADLHRYTTCLKAALASLAGSE